MAVHIRLTRGGTKKVPFYRIVVTDARSPRGGRFLENIGTFDPSAGGEGVFKINHDRLGYWRGVGAQPSATVEGLVRRAAREAKAGTPVAATSVAKKK
jgi:small subunit ribosomal protein S16